MANGAEAVHETSDKQAKGQEAEPNLFDIFRLSKPSDKTLETAKTDPQKDTNPALSPLVGAKLFQIMEQNGEPNNWMANSENGQELIEQSFTKAHLLDKLDPGVIKGTSADNANAVNKWLKAENMSIQLQDGGPGLYLAAKMQINTKYQGGKDSPLESSDGKTYDGFRKPATIKEVDGKPVVVLNDNPQNGPLIYLTPTEGKVSGTEATQIGEDIAGKIASASDMPDKSYVHMANTFIHAKGDIKELVGATNLATGHTIDQAVLETIDWTNKNGSGFVQAAAAAVSRGLAAGPQDSQIFKLDSDYVKTYVIPGVGAVASVPVGREDWKNPPAELIKKFGGE